MPNQLIETANTLKLREWGELRSTPEKRLNGNGVGGGVYDPAFSGNRLQPIHRWVPWIAGYSARFVADVLVRSDKKGQGVVLDPFSGVGTTLLEGRLKGHEVLGFDINPWPALVCRTKLAAGSKWTAEVLERSVSKYAGFVRTHRAPQRRPPQGFRSRIPFFSPKVERKVLLALDFIDSLDDEWIRSVFRVALGGVMVSFSNYSYEPSLGSRPGAGKDLIEEADVAGVLSNKLLTMVEDTRWLEQRGVPKATWKLHKGDFNDFASFTDRRADIAITSPPYLNNYHYVRNTRPQLWWLDLVKSSDDLRFLEDRNVGKFWQTVRDGENVDLEFEHKPLDDLIRGLRKLRTDHGIYGGAGWANYTATYFNDTYRFLHTLRGALNPGGTAVIVVGNSIIQGVNIPVDELLGELAEKAGLTRTRIDVLRTNRVGASILNSSVRRGNATAKATSLYESAVILQASVRET